MTDVVFTTDPAQAWSAARELLGKDPVRNNVVSTLLAQRSASGAPVRCWLAKGGGVVFQSPDTFPVVLSTMSLDDVGVLAEAVATVGVPGAFGIAADAAAFAGAYATASRHRAMPVEGQRIYELTAVRPPREVDGQLRQATAADVDLLTEWIDGFTRDTDDVPDTDARSRARAVVDAGRYWIWETSEGEPVSSALTAPEVMGVVRIGGVYTPPALRGRGFAAAAVARLSTQILAQRERPILYTQLHNPTSNGIYQRIGFEPVAEVVRYSFA